MNYRIQSLTLFFVRENDRSEFCPVELVPIQNFAAKSFDDPLQSDSSRLNYLACGVVGIEHVTAEFAKAFNDE
jgi:hypothetical protein